MKKIADKGATEAFIRSHLKHTDESCLIWPFCRNDKGYGLAVIGGVQKGAHRWMCILAHVDAPKGMHAAHSCGNGHNGCVNPLHLRWATPKQNASDRDQHGTKIYGQRSGKTHLTTDDVLAIRSASPNLSALSARYGVSIGCISKIRSRQRWPHI